MNNSNIQVIVVPENDKFKHDTSHELVVYINKNLGVPKIIERNAKYLVPYWLDEQSTDRIYEIKPFEIFDEDDCYAIYLGNSFKLEKKWDNRSNNRRFEYWSLEVFGMKELTNGILVPIDFDIAKLLDNKLNNNEMPLT